MKKSIIVLLLVFFVGLAAHAAGESNLRAWYKLDETSGTVLNDSSGNGFHTSVQGNGTPFWDADGAVGGALRHKDAWSNLWVTVPTEVFSTMDQQATFACWVQRTNLWDDRTAPSEGSSGGGLFCGTNSGGAEIISERLYYSGSSQKWYMWYKAGSPTVNWWYDYGLNAGKDDWIHLAVVFDGIAGTKNLYANGQLAASYASESGDSMADIVAFNIFTRTSKVNGGDWWDSFHGKMDDFRIYDTALNHQEIATLGSFEKANNPYPENFGIFALEPPLDIDVVTLSWSTGVFATSHNVFMGTDETAVAAATTESVELFKGNQSGTTFITDPLTAGMYYWRVDEVDGNDVWPGEVWSFKISAIPQPVLWLKMDGPTEGEDVRFVKDSSVFGNHGIMGTKDAWTEISGYGGGIDFFGGNGEETQVAFENDGNDLIEDMGLTDQVTISFLISGFSVGDNGYTFIGKGAGGKQIMSMEAPTSDKKHFLTKMGTGEIVSNWTWGAFEPGNWNYIFNTSDIRRLTVTADLTAGKVIYYLDNTVWDTFTNGIAGSFTDLEAFVIAKCDGHAYDMVMGDFRIYNQVLPPEYIEFIVGDYTKLAKKPVPADRLVDNTPDAITMLSWSSGRNAVAHDVYFGKNFNIVKNAGISSSSYIGQQTATTYPLDDLELMKTYYWRIDEVDAEGGITKGLVWQFSTIESIMVEDFESYDLESNPIGDIWIDKYGFTEVDVALNNPEEGGPVLSPINSMRLMYHVPFDPYYSVAACTFSSAQDWTVNGVKMLTIHYYGDAANMELPAFVTIGDGTNDASVFVDVNTLAESWGEMNVSLPAIELLGVDLSNVTYMEIGFGDGTDQGMGFNQKNTIYIDDIVLYPPSCVPSESSLQADFTGDCRVDYYDLAYIADNWLSEEELNTNFVDYSILASEWLVEDFWP